MRSTPITLVWLSFPHNRSLSLYSPLLNWSILHLNQDISTLLLERRENKYGWVSYSVTLKPTSGILTFLQNIMWKQRRKISECAGAGLLLWCELLRVINTHLNPDWRELSHQVISSEKGKHAFPVIISNDNSQRDASRMLMKAQFLTIQQKFSISTWACNWIIYMHNHTFIYSYNSQWA